MSAVPSLKDLLATVQPRDLSGSRASNRFDYQKDWTLVLLMHLHDESNDYLVILDYHDDVVLLDSSSAPQKASFFQIKTNKGGNWTIAQLTKRKKGKAGPLPSHLGKLWSHQITFTSNACQCYFVTNGIFPFCPSAWSDGLGDNTDCELLGATDYSALVQAIKTELNLPVDPDLKKRLTFVRSPLSVKEHSEHASGKLTSFITKRHPTGKFHASSAYRALADELGRRADREGAFASFDLLSAHKGVSRAAFENMLQSIGVADDLDAVWSRYDSQLAKDGVAFSELETLHAAWRQFEIERMDVSNEELRALSSTARDSITQFLQSTNTFTLAQLADECSSAVLSQSTRPASYIKAVVLMEYHHVSKLQTSHPQSKATAP